MRIQGTATRETCSCEGCELEAFRRGYCVVHYRLTLPRCQVEGCTRPAVSLKMCWPHRKLRGGPVHTKPKRSSTGEGRVLAWGRLYIAADAKRRVEEEALRRGGSPSGVLAEIVERWAREFHAPDGEQHDREILEQGGEDGMREDRRAGNSISASTGPRG